MPCLSALKRGRSESKEALNSESFMVKAPSVGRASRAKKDAVEKKQRDVLRERAKQSEILLKSDSGVRSHSVQAEIEIKVSRPSQLVASGTNKPTSGYLDASRGTQLTYKNDNKE